MDTIRLAKETTKFFLEFGEYSFSSHKSLFKYLKKQLVHISGNVDKEILLIFYYIFHDLLFGDFSKNNNLIDGDIQTRPHRNKARMNTNREIVNAFNEIYEHHYGVIHENKPHIVIFENSDTFNKSQMKLTKSFLEADSLITRSSNFEYIDSVPDGQFRAKYGGMKSRGQYQRAYVIEPKRYNIIGFYSENDIRLVEYGDTYIDVCTKIRDKFAYSLESPNITFCEIDHDLVKILEIAHYREKFTTNVPIFSIRIKEKYVGKCSSFVNPTSKKDYQCYQTLDLAYYSLYKKTGINGDMLERQFPVSPMYHFHHDEDEDEAYNYWIFYWDTLDKIQWKHFTFIMKDDEMIFSFASSHYLAKHHLFVNYIGDEDDFDEEEFDEDYEPGIGTIPF